MAADGPGDVLLVRVNVAGSPDWRYLVIEDPSGAVVAVQPFFRQSPNSQRQVIGAAWPSPKARSS